MSLLQNLTKWVGQKTQSAEAEYRRIIARHANPKSGDEARLAALLDVLHFTTEDVERHIEAVDKMEAILSAAGACEDLRQAVKDRRAELTAAQAEHAELVAKSQAKIKACDTAVHQTLYQCGEAEAAKREVGKLLDEYPFLWE